LRIGKGDSHGRAGNLAPVAIGMTLTLNIIMGGALTGAAFNPAPAIDRDDLAGDPVRGRIGESDDPTRDLFWGAATP
jgi:hypothetical protein